MPLTVIAPLTLALEASTYTGSVAVLRGRDLLAEREVAMRGEREERLMPAVAAALADAQVSVAALDRVVCGAGPGSFTSLRIAAAIAKGLAVGSGCELYAVSSLALVVAGAEPTPPPGHYLALLDALRGEYFAQEVHLSNDGAAVARGPAMLIPYADVAGAAAERGLTPTGADQALALRPHARGVARVAEPALVDIAAWEPAYGRLAEAQVKWEAAHGRALPTASPSAPATG